MSAYDDFNEKLKACSEGDINDFIDDNLLGVVPAAFGGNSGEYTKFRMRIAKKFGVDYTNVFIVGSGCIGFSLKRGGAIFDSGCDIDVAIVDEELFEDYSKILTGYHYDYIYRRVPMDKNQRLRYGEFLAYYAVGWLRPDKGTDIMNKHPRVNDWWGYFRSISYGKSEVGNHKVNAGIYKSKHYLYEYQKIGLLNHRKGIM